jgi:hypothetical protein
MAICYNYALVHVLRKLGANQDEAETSAMLDIRVIALSLQHLRPLDSLTALREFEMSRCHPHLRIPSLRRLKELQTLVLGACEVSNQLSSLVTLTALEMLKLRNGNWCISCLHFPSVIFPVVAPIGRCNTWKSFGKRLKVLELTECSALGHSTCGSNCISASLLESTPDAQARAVATAGNCDCTAGIRFEQLSEEIKSLFEAFLHTATRGCCVWSL